MAGLRWLFTLPFTVFLLLGVLDVRNPDAVTLAVLVLVVLAMGLRPVQRKVEKWVSNSRLLKSGDLILWNVFLSFVLLELGLSAADHFWPSPLLMAPNAKSQERIDHYKDSLPERMDGDPRNSSGFNDTEWAVPKPAGTFRIAALGDSFAFGVVGYEENFLTLLEQKLAGKVPTPVEICNLGIPALDPVDYLQVLSLEERALEPDLVLVCLFAGNDFVRASRGSLLRLRNTRTFAVLWRLWRVHEETNRLSASSRDLEDRTKTGFVEPPVFSDQAYLEIAARYLPVLRRSYSTETQAKVHDTLTVLDRIASESGDDRLVVAVLPCEVQVNPNLRAKVCRLQGISEEQLDLDHPAREVTKHFRGRDVMVVDLLPMFQAAEAGGSTYRHNDSHWNGRGNRIAADALVPVLRSKIAAPANR